MKTKRLRTMFAVSSLVLAVGCGGGSSPGPSVPAAPANLAATAGNGQVTLTWDAVSGASSYTIYQSTKSGSGKSGTPTPGITTTSHVATGLTDDTIYFFVVTASNSAGEGAASNEASAMPTAPGSFVQSDVQGTWRFSILSAGTAAGWMRGTLNVDGSGNVTVASFVDQTASATAPAGFMPVLLIDPAGHVRDAPNAVDAKFTGDLGATKKNMIVATASSGGTQSIAILQKHDSAVVFATGGTGGSGSDVAGWGSVGGPRKFVYDQISSGASPQEWEFAVGQSGQNPQVQYSATNTGPLLPYTAPSSPTRPANKVTTLAITADGVVSETVTAGNMGTQPDFLLTSGFMSDDKTLIVGVGLQPSPNPPTSATGRHVLRIYHVTNVNSSSSVADPTTGQESDLAGNYSFRKLVVGSSALSASGTLAIDAAGSTSYSSYQDSSGSTTAPAGFTLTMVPPDLTLGTSVTQFWGTLENTQDPNLHGKLSYDKDMVVITTTEASGESSLTIALK